MEQRDGGGEDPGPNYIIGGNRIVSEESWPDLEAHGVENLVDALPEDDPECLRRVLAAEARFTGAENLLLGDAYDATSGRPLRHKPGLGLYVTRDGIARRQKIQANALAHDREQPRQSAVLRLGKHSVTMTAGKRVDLRDYIGEV